MSSALVAGTLATTARRLQYPLVNVDGTGHEGTGLMASRAPGLRALGYTAGALVLRALARQAQRRALADDARVVLAGTLLETALTIAGQRRRLAARRRAGRRAPRWRPRRTA
jgi:hypothetical protein